MVGERPNYAVKSERKHCVGLYFELEECRKWSSENYVLESLMGPKNLRFLGEGSSAHKVKRELRRGPKASSMHITVENSVAPKLK